ncbi:MFS transporter [Acinetobacter sp. S40]|uniref:MFS transporter n=1 Tax=unclassified Acinetobacter TaxID=196816 RepID=UPI001909CCF5|nr:MULTISPECIES: MFS transporter [unclassified Acinetobacter]MBJ9986657.1 MFS transporter [Acinetobacter sp. S40]MBK0063225.1 MFS transporter [Acinetobacter sp. S55]MBK0066863.1 MFS transporter [Acinetobacter sp. S54]
MKSSSIYTPTVILMAVAAGICSGSNYFSQPLVHSMALSLHLSETTIAWVPTLAQIAYASGLLFLMPLGDILEKRRLLFILMLLASVGLLISGFSNHIGLIMLGTLITGLFSVSAQLLLPLAASLVPIQHSGRVVGFLISGLMIGILLARSLSGLMSTLFAWNIIYLISGFLLLAIAIILYHKIGSFPATKSESYFKTIRSIPVIFKENQRLRRRSYIGFLTFAGISMTFTTMSLLLAPAPYYFSDFTIGLFGFVGIIGTFIANFSGKYIDQGYIHKISICCGFGLILSWIFFSLLPVSFVFYVLATVLIYSCLSAVHVTNQSIVFKLNEQLRSRFNAIYMTSYFTGGAVGTTAGSYAWRHYGWQGVCVLGIFFAILTLYGCLRDAKSSPILTQ